MLIILERIVRDRRMPGGVVTGIPHAAVSSKAQPCARYFAPALEQSEIMLTS